MADSKRVTVVGKWAEVQTLKKVTRNVSPRLRDRDAKESAELSELSTRSDQSRNRVL